MYIRKVYKKNRNTGEVYTHYRLVESYRNARGEVRQQVLLNLGADFSVEGRYWKELADRIEAILSGQNDMFGLHTELENEAQQIASMITKRQADTPAVTVQTPDIQAADLNSIKHSDVRTIGAEHVGYEAAKLLELPSILADCGFNSRQVNLALATIISRLVNPQSELATHEYLQKDSALDEVIGCDFTKLGLNSLYGISDILLKHKDDIETKLYSQEKDLFNLKETITLFDITNTYFEGRSLANSKARYGRSKEKRSDCQLVALGLLLDSSGFPKKSKIYPGNVSEPSTLQEMLTELRGNKEVTVIMDAGIATADNITYLKEQDYKYIVVSRNHSLIMPEDVELTTVKEVKNNTVTTALVVNEESNEIELYCHSEAKEAKAREIITKTTQRYETELTKLAAGLAKETGTKKYDKILLKVGRLAEKYKTVSMLYTVTVIADKDNSKAIDVQYAKKESVLHKKETGIYCLRSNRHDLDAKTLWETYTMLTDLEGAFRSLKSELGFRPVYHQQEHRIDGHLFISILAYHLLHTVRYQLKAKEINHSWDNLRKILSRQYRITSTIQLADGKSATIRKTSSPTAEQLEIYKTLNITSMPGKIIKTFI